MLSSCSLASAINPDELITWKSKHPEAVVISYVNTSAEIKALSDYFCTSANAVEITNSIPADKEILFPPDMFLGHTSPGKLTGRICIYGQANVTHMQG